MLQLSNNAAPRKLPNQEECVLPVSYTSLLLWCLSMGEATPRVWTPGTPPTTRWPEAPLGGART